MKIRTQLIISMVFFGVALAIISASVISTNQQVERLNKQEELAKNIELKVGELSYLSNDYLLYHESQQIDRWESKYSSFSEDASNLTVDGSDQQVLVNNIKANGQRLKEIFGDVVSRIESAPPIQQSTVGPAFIQVSWSRMGVQTQGIVFDASRLAQSLREQADQMQQKNSMLVFSLMGAFIALLLANYLLFYRGTLKSIEFLQAGTSIIGSGNLDFSLEEKRNDEVGELSKAFNRMTANLKTVTASKEDLEREIVERERAEQVLQKQASLIDLSPDGIMILRMDGTISFWSHGAELLYGWTRKEAIGQVSHVLLKTQVSQPFEQIIEQVRLTGIWSGEFIHCTKDGTQVVVQSRLQGKFDDLGNLSEILESNVDFTERKRAMKEIESLAKFPKENPNPIMRIAADGNIIYANQSSAPLLKAWGCQVGETLPDGYRNLILEAYRSGKRNEIEATSGSTIYSLIIAPIVDMGYVNVYGRDVTQHKLADKAQKESEQRFRDAIDHFPNVFVIYDADRRVTYVNSNGLQIMGLSEQEVIGRRDEEIFPPEMINSYLPALKLAVETKMPQTLERTRSVSMGGQTIIANIIPLLGEGGGIRQILGITYDITERKRQEEQITKLTRLYSVLSRVNESIVRVHDEDSLYSEICRIVAEVGGYPLVWIGQVKDGLVLPVAWSGPASDYLLEIRVEVQGELGKGPTGTCISENRSVVNDDFATNPATSPWREPAQRYGFHASAAFPLQLQGKVIGAFTLYASEPKAFDKEQVGLLESLSADISYALDALDKEQHRVLAEEGLRETRDYLENLIDYANAPIIVWDSSFKITRFNHAFERLTGLRASEAIGEQLDTLFPEESRDGSLEYISRTTSGERWEVVEIPIKKIDGSVRTVLWNSANIYGKDGTTAVATIAQGQDITERKQAEEALGETKEYLENLIDYANAPIIVWDTYFRITRFNHAFERLTGLDAREVNGKPLDILFPERSKEDSLKYIKRALSGERWDVVEIPILRTDGSIRTVLWNSANIYDKASVVATIAQGQDITERKRAEEGLRKARDELEQRVQERTADLTKASMELEARAQELAIKTEDLIRSNSELEQFAYVASHDLQEPLRMISSYVQLLSRRYEGKLDKDADDFIAYAVEGTKRMQQLINDLLAYSRVGTRGKPPAPTDFEDVFSEAMANLRMATEEAGAVVTHDQLPTAMADKPQMVQLFQNLIGNAIKFRGKEIPQVHVSARPEEDKWVFSVRDNGIGIDPQFHDRIFTIFQRLHGREEYPGTGIGLAVSKKIVERHGGRIWLESSPGIGTTFYFTVPIHAEIEATNYAEQNEGRIV